LINTDSENKLLSSLNNNIITSQLFINIIESCLYQYDSGINTPHITMYNFILDLEKDLHKSNVSNQQNKQKIIAAVKTILNINDGATILDKTNILSHLPNSDMVVQHFISQHIESLKTINKSEYKTLITNIIQTINIYYEINLISNDLIEFNNFINYTTSNSISAFESAKLYKEIVTKLYNGLDKLNSLNTLTKDQDYFIIDSKEAVDELAESMTTYLGEVFSNFNTGYDLFDNIINGVESGTLITMSAPSNHGKSLMMVNLLNNIIVNNINNFEDRDAIIIVTLEDDIKLLLKRILSIFGNVLQNSIKYLYTQTNESLSQTNEIDNNLRTKFKDLISETIYQSIYTKTGDKITLVVKHADENIFSPADLSNFIIKLKTDNNLNVKLAFMDYIDVSTPSVNKTKDPYKDQGTIVQELRTITRNFNIPVITATQNNKSSETNLQYTQSNAEIGDSYLKIRYSDIVIMMRMMDSIKDIFDDSVQKDCFTNNQYVDSLNNQLSPKLLNQKADLTSKLIPMEFKITKSKNSGKGKSRFMLFCPANLKIYNNIQEYFNDEEEMKSNSKKLNNKIEGLKDLSISAIADDFLDNF